MRTYRTAVFALVAFSCAALPVAAQDVKTVEVTPYVGLGLDGSTPIGTAVTFPLTSSLSLETDVAYRRDAGIHALSTSASLLWSLPRIGLATPYLAGGVGLAQYGAPIFSATGVPIATQRRLTSTVNLGAGVKMPMNDKLDMRTDARWIKSFGRQGSEQFRVAQGLSFDLRKR
jgi:opacity protein-like surface antigen